MNIDMAQPFRSCKHWLGQVTLGDRLRVCAYPTSIYHYLSLDERGVDYIVYSHNNRLLLTQPNQRVGIILNKYATGIRQQIIEIEVNSFDFFSVKYFVNQHSI